MEPSLSDALIGNLEEWVAGLPEYQQHLVKDLLATRPPAEAAQAWLNSSGPPRDTAPFGGIRTGANLFYEKLLRQIHLLLCGEAEYAEERQQLIRRARAGQATVVTAVATAVAPHVGATAVLIAPAVALTLAVVGGASREAACETLASMIARRENPSGGAEEEPEAQTP